MLQTLTTLRGKNLNLDPLANHHKAYWGAQTYALNYCTCIYFVYNRNCSQYLWAINLGKCADPTTKNNHFFNSSDCSNSCKLKKLEKEILLVPKLLMVINFFLAAMTKDYTIYFCGLYEQKCLLWTLQNNNLLQTLQLFGNTF